MIDRVNIEAFLDGLRTIKHFLETDADIDTVRETLRQLETEDPAVFLPKEGANEFELSLAISQYVGTIHHIKTLLIAHERDELEAKLCQYAGLSLADPKQHVNKRRRSVSRGSGRKAGAD